MVPFQILDVNSSLYSLYNEPSDLTQEANRVTKGL